MSQSVKRFAEGLKISLILCHFLEIFHQLARSEDSRSKKNVRHGRVNVYAWRGLININPTYSSLDMLVRLAHTTFVQVAHVIS